MSDRADSSKPANKHHWLWQATGGPQLYLLLCEGARVTLRSQQTRAMNLAWALRETLQKTSTRVAVIGGGGAGITFAAAAARLGATVTLYESHQLMHLQQGSWHRPLHPEIYTWPADTAFRPVSHLPLLGWTTGTAHDVATEIVAKFRSLAYELGPDRLMIEEGVRVTLDRVGCVHATPQADGKRFDLVVIATGFGVESGPPGAALNSYWRSDALDQPFLDASRNRVVISGSGDGGLIELLRVCVQETDQAAFLDLVLSATLDVDLLREVRKFNSAEFKPGRGAEVQEGYKRLTTQRFRSLELIDEFLSQHQRPGVEIEWLYTTVHPFDSPSLPINRFLVSRLLPPHAKFNIQQTQVLEKPPPAVSTRKGGKVHIKYQAHKPICCDYAAFRWGTQKEHKVGQFKTPRPILRSVSSIFEDPTKEQVSILVAFLGRSSQEHSWCNQPMGWPDDPKFFKPPKVQEPPPFPRLLAEFVMAFDSPDQAVRRRPIVFRIRTWIVGLAPRVSVRYDLHPETHKPVTRIGIGKFHRQWINTRNDYSIRVRTANGFEWTVCSVLQALRARYDLNPEQEQDSGASPQSRGPMPYRKKRDAKFLNAGTMDVKMALEILTKQTGLATV